MFAPPATGAVFAGVDFPRAFAIVLFCLNGEVNVLLHRLPPANRGIWEQTVSMRSFRIHGGFGGSVANGMQPGN